MSEADQGEWSSKDIPPTWAWANFGQVFVNVTSSDRKLKQKSYLEAGSYPVVDQGQSEVGGWTDDASLIHPGPLPAVIFGDHTRCVKYVTEPFVQGADGVKVLVPQGVEPRFAELALRTVVLPDKGYSRHFKFLKATQFPVAPLNEQRRIVAKIDALQARSRRAREALDAVPALLDRFRQSVFAAAFRGDLTADWRAKNPDVEPASVLLDRIRAERKVRWVEAEAEKARAKAEEKARKAGKAWGPKDDAKAVSAARKKAEAKYTEPEPVDAEAEGLPELPEGWCWASFGEAFHVAVGATPSRREPSFWNGDVPWVSSGEVQFCRISTTRELITEAGLANTSTEVHPRGTVLLGMIGQGRTRGQAAILDVEACNNQNAAAIRVSEAGLPPEYVFHYLWLEYEKTRRLGSGNQQAALNKSRVQAMRLPLMPLGEVEAVVERVEAALGGLEPVSTALEASRDRLDTLDQAILAKAFRGELAPQDPDDEPAAVLLERIKAERAANATKKKAPRGRRKLA
ncbi:MAG: restriction endonuclease subunit S [Alphaproteobacteria bacterium]|nr:restriction endonuclease subunit S [Alphaproteobacteria bacterium]